MPFTQNDLASALNQNKALQAANPQLRLFAHQPLLAPLPPQSSPPSKSSTKSISPTGKPELASHAEFLHWIKKLNRSLPPNQPLLAIHANPTRPSGILPGWPDFSLFHSASILPLFIEFKRPRIGKLSTAQSLIHHFLHSLGHSLYTVTSSSNAIHLTLSHFHLQSP